MQTIRASCGYTALVTLRASGSLPMWSDIQRRLQTLGCPLPTGQQVDALGMRCLSAALRATPWSRSFDLPPVSPHNNGYDKLMN
jgi:hypothetical protein